MFCQHLQHLNQQNQNWVPVVTLSKENDKNLLEQLKAGFKRTAKWNKWQLITNDY